MVEAIGGIAHNNESESDAEKVDHNGPARSHA